MKRNISLILAALMLASTMTACGNGTAKETDMAETKSPETSTSVESVDAETSAPETEDPWADTETLRNDKTAFALASLTTSIGLEIREHQLFVTSLKTESMPTRSPSSGPWATMPTLPTRLRPFRKPGTKVTIRLHGLWWKRGLIPLPPLLSRLWAITETPPAGCWNARCSSGNMTISRP